MINVERKTPPQEVLDILEKEKNKESGTYNKKEVFNILVEEFYNKCYICENKEPSSLNIEHFKPHRGNEELKFKWNNLFLACAHCNNIKSDKYDNILDCTNPEHDVEKWIKYYADTFPRTKVEITSLKDEEIVNNTVELLNKVYNGTTYQKEVEGENIVKKLKKELIKFQTNLWEYDEAVDKEEKDYYIRKIKKQLHFSSSFTSFKRWIIRDTKVLYDEFKQFI